MSYSELLSKSQVVKTLEVIVTCGDLANEWNASEIVDPESGEEIFCCAVDPHTDELQVIFFSSESPIRMPLDQLLGALEKSKRSIRRVHHDD